MTNANQPNNDSPLFDDTPSYSPNDSVAPAPEQDNLPEPVVDAPAEKDSTPEPAPAPGRRKVKKTTAGSMWVGLVISGLSDKMCVCYRRVAGLDVAFLDAD